MIKSQESSSSEESVSSIPALLSRILAFGLNFIIFIHSLLILLLLLSGALELNRNSFRRFLLWSLAYSLLPLINMALLAIPWKRRLFSRLRFGAVGVNIIAAIAFFYHIEYVRTGLSNQNKIIESIIFLAIVGTFILAFLLVKPSSIRNPLVCSKCGYDLRGTDHDKCPECGWGREVEG